MLALSTRSFIQYAFTLQTGLDRHQHRTRPRRVRAVRGFAATHINVNVAVSRRVRRESFVLDGPLSGIPDQNIFVSAH